MVTHHRRSVAPLSGQTRVQTRIHSTSAPVKRPARIRRQTNAGQTRGTPDRGRLTSRQRGDKEGRFGTSRSGVLQPLLPGSEKVGGVETDPQLNSAESVHPHQLLPNGNPQTGAGGSQPGRVASFHRSQGRLFSHSHPRVVLPLPAVYGRESCVRVHRSPVRTCYCPSGIHAGHASTGGFSPQTISSIASVLRRLADSAPQSYSTALPRSTSMETYCHNRSDPQYREVLYDPQPRHGVCGHTLYHQTGYSLPHPGEGGQTFGNNPDGLVEYFRTGQSYSSVTGGDDIYDRHRPVGQASPAPGAAVLARALASTPAPARSPYSGETCPQIPSEVVAGGEQSTRGHATSQLSTRQCSVHRCLPHRLGSPSGQLASGGPVGTTGQNPPHQLAGTSGSVSGLKEVRTPCDCAPHISQHRQYDCSCLYQQNGGDQIPVTVLPTMGSNDVVQREEHRAKSSTPPRQTESHSRCVIAQPTGARDRMGHPSTGGGSSIPQVGVPHTGPVCDIRESQAPTVCVPGGGPQSSGDGRSVNSVEGTGRVRLSSPPPTPVSAPQNSGGGHDHDPDRPAVAQQIMVPSPVRTASRAPSGVTTQRGSTEPGEEPSPSGPKRLPPSRVQVVEQALLEKGFSKSTAAVIARPQRPSTLATYEDKWRKFVDWCDGRQINSVAVTCSQLADFLLFLFREKQFSPKTIAVYRTAIAATIRGLGGEDFGHNPILSAMIRNFMIEKPPKRVTTPQWSLSLVLRVLQAAPFEPMDAISMKALTYKTVFLLALASGRRRSELHALSTEKGLLRLSKEEAVLRTRPGFLAKNQVLGSVSSPISIKALDHIVGPEPEERYLCPVRALRWYLNRTKPTRQGRVRLFLPIPPATKLDCSAGDISKWIVGTVRWAYAEGSDTQKSLSRVTAHEVRALSASWALSAGVPVNDFLQAGTWRSANSFISFYLRDMASELDGLKALGPMSVSQSIIQSQP